MRTSEEIRADPTLARRFDAKVMPEPMSGCWLWTGAVLPRGYGTIGVGGAAGGHEYAHRVSFALRGGDLRQGLHIHHLCNNPSCVNPDHLRQVTARENILASDGPSARCARKTHCDKGHPLSGANLYRWKHRRYCRACRDAIERGRVR